MSTVSETRTASVWRAADGIVHVKIRAGVVQSIEDARLNLEAAGLAADGERCPILVDISGAEPLEAEVRHVYTGETLITRFEALALCTDASRLGVMMANVYLRVARLAIPARLFTERASASEWLSRQRRGDG